jgi:hypothetical protein
MAIRMRQSDLLGWGKPAQPGPLYMAVSGSGTLYHHPLSK